MGLTEPVPVGEYAGVGPPMELPSFGETCRFRQAGWAPSHPFGAVGIMTLPVRPWAVVLAPLANWSRTTSPAARMGL